MIPETKDMFIAYGDHTEWGTAHTVWGELEEWYAAELIIAQAYSNYTHPDFGEGLSSSSTEGPHAR